MTLPRTVADVLSDHVVLEVECIDRLYLNVYQPWLQYPAGAAASFVGHRGARFASSALMDPISRAFVASVDRFARDERVTVISFEKGQRKDDVARLPGRARGRRPSGGGVVRREGAGEDPHVPAGLRRGFCWLTRRDRGA
jgi:hypothetical protein